MYIIFKKLNLDIFDHWALPLPVLSTSKAAFDLNSSHMFVINAILFIYSDLINRRIQCPVIIVLF